MKAAAAAVPARISQAVRRVLDRFFVRLLVGVLLVAIPLMARRSRRCGSV
jgi:hypothetical protein